MLNVDEAHRSSSQPFIRPLLSGVQGNGNSAGLGSGTVCWGHEHCASCCLLGAVQQLLMDLVVLIKECSGGASRVSGVAGGQVLLCCDSKGSPLTGGRG